jgi:hypothetical protein
MYILLICLLKFAFSHFDESDNTNDYFQLIERVSFSLLDKKSHHNFLQNFNFEGTALLMDNNLKMAPRINNTYGLIYSKEQIHSEDIRIHLTFKIKPEEYIGSALVLWLFKDEDLDSLKDRSFIGFKVFNASY